MKMFNGRINRLSYLVFWILSGLLITLRDQYQTNLPDYFYISINLVIIVFGIISGIRRFHDLNKSGWWFFTLLIPIFNIYSAVLLLFVPGTIGKNRFGSQPNRGLNLTPAQI